MARMRKRSPIAWLGAMAASLTLAGHAHGATVAISCSALGIELELCRSGAQAWAEATGNEIEIVSTPNSATERLALYQQILSAGGDDIDVYQIDVIWPGILAEHFIDLTPHMDGGEDAHFPESIRNNTVAGELKAMPWFIDAGVLYYRTDLLDAHDRLPPTTWTELAETARAVMESERASGNERMWGYVFQGRAYEGLTCNALEWIVSHGGGAIVAEDGSVTVDNERAAAALSEAASWVASIAPEGVLNYDEEEARGVFQSGNAVFMRNWPYAWALANSDGSPVAGKVGVVALPRGNEEGRRTGTLGGQQLAVSRYSAHPELAADLVRHLTSADEQKRRALIGSYNPTIPALYEDEEVLEAVPFLSALYETFLNAVARPSRVTGESYNRVSAAFWNAVHATLSGETEADSALADLQRDLERLKRRGW